MLRGIIRRGAKSARSPVGLLDGSDWDGARWIAFEELPDSLRVVPGQEFNKIKIGDRKTALNRLPEFRREAQRYEARRAGDGLCSAAWDSSSCF